MNLRLANNSDVEIIWVILQDAIAQRKKDGSDQWQNGYPNKQTVVNDIANGYGYVLEENNIIMAYAAIIFGIEPTYQEIKGNWLSDDPYVVVHRVATSEMHKGKGIATKLFLLLEGLALSKNTFSIKVDTNFDNRQMLTILDKLNYTYCGEIFFSGASRRAYQKIL
jgi:GNAT superfamily N-acetyltransferase